MILSMSSDLRTRQIVWTGRGNDDSPMGSRLQPQLGISAFAIAGQNAEIWKDEATTCPVSGWKHGSTLQDPDALYDRLMRS